MDRVARSLCRVVYNRTTTKRIWKFSFTLVSGAFYITILGQETLDVLHITFCHGTQPNFLLIPIDNLQFLLSAHLAHPIRLFQGNNINIVNS